MIIESYVNRIKVLIEGILRELPSEVRQKKVLLNEKELKEHHFRRKSMLQE